MPYSIKSEFRLILKYMYHGELINQCHTQEKTEVRYLCRQKKNKKTADLLWSTKSGFGRWEAAPESPQILGCTFACSAFKRQEVNINCIFTDFPKFQRLVEISETIDVRNNL